MDNPRRFGINNHATNRESPSTRTKPQDLHRSTRDPAPIVPAATAAIGPSTPPLLRLHKTKTPNSGTGEEH